VGFELLNGVHVVFGLGSAQWRTLYLSTGSDLSLQKAKAVPAVRPDGKRVMIKVVAGIGFEPMTLRL